MISNPVEKARRMKELIESAGWKELMEYADAQLLPRTDQVVLRPLSSLDKAGEQEFMKGEIAGIRLFCKMPEALLVMAEADAAKAAKTQEASPDEPDRTEFAV